MDAKVKTGGKWERGKLMVNGVELGLETAATLLGTVGATNAWGTVMTLVWYTPIFRRYHTYLLHTREANKENEKKKPMQLGSLIIYIGQNL